MPIDTIRPLPRLRRTAEHSNKENLYAIPHHRHPDRLFRGDSASELPTTSTQVGQMEPVCFEKHLRDRELFSTSSSLSDDELELSKKKKRERFSACYSTSDLTTSDSSIGPSYIKSNGRFILIPSFRHNTANSTTSLECSDNLQHEFKLDHGDNDSLNSDDDQEDEQFEEEEELNKRTNKIGFLNDLRRLDSIEESPPVLPSPSNIHDDQDLPPKITPVRFSSSARFPYTNPYQQPATPQLLSNSNRRMAFEQPRSLFELKATRSEEFGLPSQMAKHYGIKGILFMTISMSGFRSKTQLSVFVQHGTYFLQRFPELSTYLTIEIKQNKRFKKRNKAVTSNLQVYKSALVKRSHQPDFNYNVPFMLNKENFCSHDKLVISVYATNSDEFEEMPSGHEPLGRMTFSLRRLREKAKSKLNPHYRPDDLRVKVCDGGYFLLGDKFGAVTNMPQDKVYHRKFYDDIGSTAFPSNSEFESPQKMMGGLGESDWHSALRHKETKLDPRRHSIQVGSSQRIPLNGRPTSSNQNYYPSNQAFYPNQPGIENGVANTKSENRYGPFSALIGSPRKKASLPVRASTITEQQRRKEQHASSGSSLMSKGASSSNSSSSSSTGYRPHYRFTLPSITTTTDGSDCANLPSSLLHSEQSKHVNQHLLYADAAPSQQPTGTKTKSKAQKNLPSASSHRFLTNQPSVSSADNKNAPSHGAVRRVASFTYSTDDKLNKQSGKKFTFAPISKIGSLIRGKADVNSTSALYPTKEEVRLWQRSFDCLLRDKYGRHLFRQFVIREVSSENLDFYEDVEEFKKMKPGKKSTIQKANEIYNTYFKEGSAKELNLDSATKISTEAAFKAGCLPDTFNLAQSRIEQLMAKDSYARFINSKGYLDLLNSITPPPSATSSNASASVQSSGSAEEPAKLSQDEPKPLETKSKSESPVNERQEALA
ncbi:Regulator of G-protein signaling 3 [Aphelenchoides bicaudatus]|nr:Regulator of G-protein signaling 3 [Aphelenchoides bicaudatus]